MNYLLEFVGLPNCLLKTSLPLRDTTRTDGLSVSSEGSLIVGNAACFCMEWNVKSAI